MEDFLKKTKESSRISATLESKLKKTLLNEMADAILEKKDLIKKANAIDLKNGEENNLSKALMDRLLLNDDRIEAMAKSLKEIAALKEPVGRVL